MQKTEPVRSKKITDSARGKPCTLNIVGICNYDPSTTIFAHFPDESHGMARKSDDCSGGYACSACHDVIDGRRPWPEGEDAYEQWYLRRSQTRTVRMMFQEGVICVAK